MLLRNRLIISKFLLWCTTLFRYWWSQTMLLLLLLSRFSRVRLCATPETTAHQAPPSLGFSRQEHWSGLPLPSPTGNASCPKWICSWALFLLENYFSVLYLYLLSSFPSSLPLMRLVIIALYYKSTSWTLLYAWIRNYLLAPWIVLENTGLVTARTCSRLRQT